MGENLLAGLAVWSWTYDGRGGDEATGFTWRVRAPRYNLNLVVRTFNLGGGDELWAWMLLACCGEDKDSWASCTGLGTHPIVDEVELSAMPGGNVPMDVGAVFLAWLAHCAPTLDPLEAHLVATSLELYLRSVDWRLTGAVDSRGKLANPVLPEKREHADG